MEPLQGYKIDFVVTWVDGNDPKWITEKKKWEGLACGNISPSADANSDCRYQNVFMSMSEKADDVWFNAM